MHTRPNRPHQKKETARYCESFGYGGKDALNKRFCHSNGVSIYTEDG
jgi:hypothetical protein